MSRIFRARVARTGRHDYGNGKVTHTDGDALRSIVAQLPDLPITLSHEHGARRVGTVLQADHEYGHSHRAMAVIRIDDAEALARIDGGNRGCSIGFTGWVDATGRDRDIRLTHLAVAGLTDGKPSVPVGGRNMRILDEIGGPRV